MINFKKILLLMMPFSLLFAFSYTHFEKGIPTIEVEGNYAHVELVGCDQPHPGQLDLPIRLLNVALPAQTRAVSIECLAEREVLISGIEINSVSQQEYYSNWPQFFPEHNQTAELINTGLLFGVPIAQIKLRPFTYENSNGTLFLNKRIHIDFYLERWDYRAELPVTSTQYSASVRNRILEANVANRENLPAPFIFEPMDEMESRVRSFPPALGDDPSDGVAIIADRFLPYFEAFFQDEIAFGLIIEPISLEALYSAYPHGVDRVERIRQFIVDAYQKWGISGVFLVGNIEELPVRFRYGMMAIPTWEEIPTDMYFTVMDGNWNNNADRYFGEEDEDDFLPELFVGRFQPEDTLEAIAYVQKLRSHRRELNNDFIRRWLFACASLSPTGEDQMGQLICDSIIDSHLPEGIDALKMYSHFDLTGGDIELNETNFRSQLYSGRYLICHIDHGYQYILHTGKESGGGGLNIGDFLSLDNHPFFPILYTYSCEVNAIDLSSIGAASIRSTEGGLVAIIAHSRAAWTSQVNLVYYFWINNVFPYKSIKLGEILQNIFLTLADNSVYRYYKCITTLFGYPFLDVYPQGLSEVDLSFSRDSIPSEGGILTVTVLNSLTSSPIGDVSIVARTPGGKFATDITNEYGIVRLYIRPGEAEYVYISASGGGAFFTEETLAVAEPLQAYPIIERAVFHPLGGDGDTIFEPGDTFACDLSIKNCGASTADTVKFTLTSCPTLDSVAFVYSFTSFDTLTIHSAFSITAPSDCRGITNLRPVVRIESDSLFYSDTLSIYIEAPIFHHFSTEYRGGAASPFPGDTAIILLGVTNTGFGDFRGGDVDFVVSGATIDVSSYAIGTIEPLDTFILPLNLVSESIHIDGKAIFDFSNCSPETIDFDLKTPSVPDSVGMDPSVSSVELYWASPDDGLIYGYNIYRRDYTGSSLWTKLNTFPISFGTYIDEGLPEVTQFFYRVTSVSESMIESPPSDSILAWTTLTALDGWPRSIGPSIRIFASPVLYDFNDDGASEIIITGQNYSGVFALYANGEDVFDSTDAVDPFGIFAFTDSTPSIEGVWGSPALGDLTGDGDYELLVNHRDLSRMMPIMNLSDGSIESGWPRRVNTTSMGTPVLADIDGDGELEAINPTFKGIEIYNSDGSEYIPGSGGIFHSAEDGASGLYWASPAVGDIDGDGEMEIVIGGPKDSLDQGTIWAFKPDGSLVPGWPIRIPWVDFACANPVLANFDLDTTTLEILATTRLRGVYIFTHDGDTLPGWPVQRYYFWEFGSHCAAADFDNDGICEVILAGSYDVGVHRADGSILPGWPISLGITTEYPCNLTIGDVGGDASWDCVFALKDKIYAYDINGVQIPGFPLVTKDLLYGAPTLGDVNGDGLIDITVGCFDSKVYIWETGAPITPNSIAWPTEKGDYAHTGRYGEYLNIVNIDEASNLPCTIALSAYPNPFNSAVKIILGCHSRENGNPKIEIFDIAGRRVAQLPSPSVPLPEGEGGGSFSLWEKVTEGRMRAEFTWQPAPTLGSGVYLVRATFPQQTTSAVCTKRIVYLK